MKNKVIFSGQHEITKDESCLNNLIVFYGVLTGCVHNKKTEDDIDPHFSNMFDMLSHSIFIVSALSALIKLSDCNQLHLGFPTHTPYLWAQEISLSSVLGLISSAKVCWRNTAV